MVLRPRKNSKENVVKLTVGYVSGWSITTVLTLRLGLREDSSGWGVTIWYQSMVYKNLGNQVKFSDCSKGKSRVKFKY